MEEREGEEGVRPGRMGEKEDKKEGVVEVRDTVCCGGGRHVGGCGE